MTNVSSEAHIRVKRMGELDSGPFLEETKKKYDEEEANIRALKLCSLWQDHVMDPNWHPFKVINVGGETKVCLFFNAVAACVFFRFNYRIFRCHFTCVLLLIRQKVIEEGDAKLKELEMELGQEVYKAVVTAITEINEYSPSGCSY